MHHHTISCALHDAKRDSDRLLLNKNACDPEFLHECFENFKPNRQGAYGANIIWHVTVRTLVPNLRPFEQCATS